MASGLLDFPAARVAFEKLLRPAGLYVSMYEISPEGLLHEVPPRVFSAGLREAKPGEQITGKIKFAVDRSVHLAGFLVFRDARGGAPIAGIEDSRNLKLRPLDVVEGTITLSHKE